MAMMTAMTMLARGGGGGRVPFNIGTRQAIKRVESGGGRVGGGCNKTLNPFKSRSPQASVLNQHGPFDSLDCFKRFGCRYLVLRAFAHCYTQDMYNFQMKRGSGFCWNGGRHLEVQAGRWLDSQAHLPTWCLRAG